MRKYLVKIAIPSRKNRWEASVEKRTVTAETFNDMLMEVITSDELQAGARIFEIEEFAAMVKSFYFPLTVHICDFYNYDYECNEISNEFAVCYRSYIEQAFAEYQCGDTNMAQYFDEYYSATAPKKIKNIEWHFEEVNGCLYGRVDVSIIEELTPDETEALKGWIRGQNSDGIGEGFEQINIRTNCRTISVSFWNSNANYFVYDEEEFAFIRFAE